MGKIAKEIEIEFKRCSVNFRGLGSSLPETILGRWRNIGQQPSNKRLRIDKPEQ